MIQTFIVRGLGLNGFASDLLLPYISTLLSFYSSIKMQHLHVTLYSTIVIFILLYNSVRLQVDLYSSFVSLIFQHNFQSEYTFPYPTVYGLIFYFVFFIYQHSSGRLTGCVVFQFYKPYIPI